MSSTEPSDLDRRRNTRVALICAGAFFCMVGAAFAAVPAYKAFCQATGFDGTTQRAKAAPGQVLDRTITVRFDANVNGVPWTFNAKQISQQVKIGETKLAYFTVTNHADHAVTARAVYNVTPESAGAYFNKLQCFCFSDQTIGPGKTVDMPVLYFVDPGYVKDINTKYEPQVTLSYTFFPATDVAKSATDGKAATKG